MENNSIFSSPSKKRDGVMSLSPSKKKHTRLSATRQSIPTINRGIIATTPKKNGRGGLVSPSKRSNTDLDRSARKRAILTNYERLMDDDYSDYDEDMTLADKIIESSKRDGGRPIYLESEEESEGNDLEIYLPSVENTPNKRLKFEDGVRKMKKIEESEEEQEEQEEDEEGKMMMKKRKKKTMTEKKIDILPVAQDFVPTPIPKGDSLFVLEKKFDDRALFLDGFEGYFEQHKTKVKTSGNTMSQLVSLEYEEYARNIKLMELIQAKGKENLLNLYRGMFRQWYYELLQGFNLCFYGIGSKRDIIIEFVQEFLFPRLKKSQCCVINGYNTEVTIKEIVSTVISALLPNHAKYKFSKNPRDLINLLLSIISTNSRPFLRLEEEPKLILLINNIDGKLLRDERSQSILSSISQLSSVWLISSVDYINAGLMWDSSKMSKFKFVWHNATTFHNYNVESSFKDALSLGKSNKFTGSKGAKYILSSLTSNAKSLFRILLSNQLTNMEEEPELIKKPELRGSLVGSIKYGLELKHLFRLCLEEFVTSNEVSFRTMLHEFIEHKMCNLVKDNSGTEIVFIPFNMDELQKLLEEELME